MFLFVFSSPGRCFPWTDMFLPALDTILYRRWILAEAWLHQQNTTHGRIKYPRPQASTDLRPNLPKHNVTSPVEGIHPYRNWSYGDASFKGRIVKETYRPRRALSLGTYDLRKKYVDVLLGDALSIISGREVDPSHTTAKKRGILPFPCSMFSFLEMRSTDLHDPLHPPPPSAPFPQPFYYMQHLFTKNKKGQNFRWRHAHLTAAVMWTTEYTEWQWPHSVVHSIMMVNQPSLVRVRVGVARPSPFTLSTITSKVGVYAPA